MVTCVVPGCYASKKENPQNLTFHTLPQNAEIRGKWLKMVNRPDWIPKKYSTICSRHFEENCFVNRSAQRIKLRSGSVPTLFMPKQQEQILQLLKLLIPTISENNSTSRIVTSDPQKQATDKMAIPKNFNMDRYNPDIHRIDDYLDFFDSKCKIFEINDNQIRKDLLLNLLTPEIFCELKIALTPTFETSTYNEICNILLDLYRIKKTRYRALTEFWNCVRDKNESMEHYANRLKSLSRDCGYTEDLLDRQLRDRFATGLNHQELETDLKQMWPDLLHTEDGQIKEVTFSHIFRMALSREKAELDTPSSSVKKIKKKSKFNNKQRDQKSKLPRKLHSHECLRCGNHEKRNHSQCLAINHVCKECNVKGNFESCCIKSGRAYITRTSRWEGHRSFKITEPSTTDESQADSDNDEEEFICNAISTQRRDCKQIYIQINGVNCTMDWDPGSTSTYSIINTQLWRRIGSPNLQKAPKLKAYGNKKLKTKGITDVTVLVDGQQKVLPVVVMKNANPMLFGLQWTEMFGMEFPKPVYSIKTSVPTTLKQVLEKHSELFNGKLDRTSINASVVAPRRSNRQKRPPRRLVQEM